MPGRADTPALGLAAATIAVICCAGLPAITAVLGGLTIEAALGVAAGVLAVAAVATGTLVVLRVRRTCGCGKPSRRRPDA